MITPCILFVVWFLFLNIMFVRFFLLLHVVVGGASLCLCCIVFCNWFVRFPVDGDFYWFPSGAILSRAVLKTVCIFWWTGARLSESVYSGVEWLHHRVGTELALALPSALNEPLFLFPYWGSVPWRSWSILAVPATAADYQHPVPSLLPNYGHRWNCGNPVQPHGIG